jgi:hypothetical protein
VLALQTLLPISGIAFLVPVPQQRVEQNFRWGLGVLSLHSDQDSGLAALIVREPPLQTGDGERSPLNVS